MIRSVIAGAGICLLLTGCGLHAVRYTWVGDETKLPQVNLACAREVQNAGPVAGAAKHHPLTGELVGGAIPTLHKGCGGKRGYPRPGNADAALVGGGPPIRWRARPTWGHAPQTRP